MPVARTLPLSGGGTEPVFPVTLADPPTVLPSNSTPCLLAVIVAPPVILLPGHGWVPSSSPTTTNPVEPLTDSAPPIVEEQTRSPLAPDALSAPAIVAPSA